MTIMRIVLLAALDLGTKHFIFSKGIDNAFISPVINPGSAWSLDIAIPLIIGVTVVACAGFIYIYHRKRIDHAPFIMLFAGAIGNVYDRIVFNGVRDRIHIPNFPIFNIADVFLTVGVILIAFQYKKQSREQRH